MYHIINPSVRSSTIYHVITLPIRYSTIYDIIDSDLSIRYSTMYDIIDLLIKYSTIYDITDLSIWYSSMYDIIDLSIRSCMIPCMISLTSLNFDITYASYLSCNLSTNQSPRIWPIPSPQKANMKLSQWEGFKVTNVLNYLLIDYRKLWSLWDFLGFKILSFKFWLWWCLWSL